MVEIPYAYNIWIHMGGETMFQCHDWTNFEQIWCQTMVLFIIIVVSNMMNMNELT